MAYKLASLWFLLTAPIILWDCMYCFMRPHSMAGGKFHWMWKLYDLVGEVDHIYGLPAYKNKDGFTNAQALLNLVETLLNLRFVYLANITMSSSAPVVGFASALMTMSKTILYFAQEYYCDLCCIGHNDLPTILVYWVLPNSLWIIIPGFIAYSFGSEITANLRAHAKRHGDAKSG